MILLIDPDFRPHVKPGWQACCICGRGVDPNKPHRIAHVLQAGFFLLLPGEPVPKDYVDEGWQPIGSDCAEKIGLVWSKPG